MAQAEGKRQIIYANSAGESVIAPLASGQIQLRLHVADQQVSFAYSLDEGFSFLPVGSANPFFFSWWKAARPALFSFNTQTDPSAGGWIDVDWVRCQPLSH